MNPDMGLWICCGSENQGSLQINPSSGKDVIKLMKS